MIAYVRRELCVLQVVGQLDSLRGAFGGAPIFRRCRRHVDAARSGSPRVDQTMSLAHSMKQPVRADMRMP